MIAFELIFFHELYDGKQKGPETIYQSLSSLPNMFRSLISLVINLTNFIALIQRDF